MSDIGNETKRKRGIQASPAKLRKALVDANIRTQAELAEKIADMEGIDNPPRGLVNKIFRGQAVDLVSLERVARALDIESWRLYLNGEESNTDFVSTEYVDAPEKQPQSRGYIYALAILPIFTILFLGAYFYLDEDQVSEPQIQLTNKSTVRVTPFSGSRGEDLTFALEKSLQLQGLSIIPGSGNLLTKADPTELVSNNKLDYVFSGDSKQVGRYTIFNLFVTDPSLTRKVWSGSFLNAASNDYVQSLMDVALKRSQLPGGVNLSFPDSNAQENYIFGMTSLDAETTETNMLRAVTLAESALRIYPDYVNANALLCLALTRMGAENGDPSKFEEATQYCAKSLQLDENSYEAKFANATLLSRSGELEKSLNILEELIEKDSKNTSALLAYANIQTKLLVDGKMAYGDYSGSAVLLEALEIESQFWKIPSELSRIFYMLGDLKQAVEYAEAAIAIEKNVVTLNNFGTFSFCLGDFQKAEDAYFGLTQLLPLDWKGYSQLAITYYFQREFEAAINLLNKATGVSEFQSVVPYQVWGNLGSVYHQANQVDLARDAYEKSISLLEDIIANGQNGYEERAFRLALYMSVVLTNDGKVQRDLHDSLLTELKELDQNLSPSTLVNIASGWAFFGDYDRANAIMEGVVKSCPGFTKSPDYDSIFVEKSTLVHVVD